MVEIPNDKELILQFRKGNQNAFEALYSRYGDRLYTFLLYQVGNHTADDLFQDIMIIVQKQLIKFNPNGNFRAWLAKIALNKIRDHRRKENRRMKLFIFNANPNRHTEERNDEPEFDFTDKTDVVLEFINSEISELLNAAIKKLPENQRQVVNLHYLMGLTFREIADILECSINTIAARARYGLNNMRKILGPKLVNELK